MSANVELSDLIGGFKIDWDKDNNKRVIIVERSTKLIQFI